MRAFRQICIALLLTTQAGVAQVARTPIEIPSAVPEGFSREPNCVDETVCVSELLFLAHADFLALKELIDRNVSPPYVRFRMQDVMSGIVLVTATTEISAGSHAGSEFLVEKTGSDWSILRRSVFIADGTVAITAEDYERLGIIVSGDASDVGGAAGQQ